MNSTVKIPRSFVASLLLLALLGALLSFTHPAMPKDMDGTMSGCTSMGVMICPMDPLEHLAAWQGAFVATISGSIMGTLLLVLVFVVAYSVRDTSQNVTQVQRFARITIPIPRAFSRDPLARAFARGILHSKAF